MKTVTTAEANENSEREPDPEFLDSMTGHVLGPFFLSMSPTCSPDPRPWEPAMSDLCSGEYLREMPSGEGISRLELAKRVVRHWLMRGLWKVVHNLYAGGPPLISGPTAPHF